MSILRATALAIILASPLLVQPALAEKNNDAFAKSVDAAKMKLMTCHELKKQLTTAEKEADKRSGTKAAKRYSDEADSLYDLAHTTGCGWAQ